MNDMRLKELKIEVTYKCPLACIHCSSNASVENLLTMTSEKCIEIIQEATTLGIESIAFSGGEPLLWNGLAEAVDFATTNHLHSAIYTSGNNENYITVFGNLAKAGLDRAIFSLYSPIKDEHNQITRKACSFDNTLNSIDYCSAIGISPEVHFVALASNYTQLPKVVELAEMHNVKRISVLRFVPQGRGVLISGYGTMSTQQNIELKNIITNLRLGGHDIRTGSPFNVLWLNSKPKCLAGQDRLIVAPDLAIYPCDAFKQINAKEIAGTLEHSTLATHSLTECWNNSEYLNLVRATVTAPPSPPCSQCAMFEQCNAGCLAQKFLQYGALGKNPDPACLKGEIK